MKYQKAHVETVLFTHTTFMSQSKNKYKTEAEAIAAAISQMGWRPDYQTYSAVFNTESDQWEVTCTYVHSTNGAYHATQDCVFS